MGFAANDFKIPENIFELISKKFKSALSLGTIVYADSDVVYHEGRAFSYQIRIPPAFVKKPNAIQDKNQKSALLKFPPEHVILEAGPFRVVLNRYCAVKNQILLTSISLRSQSEALDAYELSSVYRILKTLPQGHIAFYNCGKASGASQPHKHVQIVGLESSEFDKLFPNQVKQRLGLASSDKPVMIQSPNVPYAHFIIQIAGECAGEHLQSLFNTLLSATESALTSHLDAPSVVAEYNFLMTPNWLIMIPRTNAAFNGVAPNSLGMLGVLWLAGQQKLSATGLDEILAHVGVSRDPGEPINYL